jgi:CHAT domain-containing protein
MKASSRTSWNGSRRSGAPRTGKHGHTGTRFRQSDWPRVWRCPTGIISFLPFHAAGKYSQPRPHSQCVMDRVISGYTSTIRALKFSRESAGASSQVQNTLIVTTSSNTLPAAKHEASRVKYMMRGSSHVSKMEDPNVDVLCRAIPSQSIVHFVCHAVAEENPSLSRLILANGSLSVADISQLRVRAGALAYLSACSTAFSPVSTLNDESIVLSSAFQLAGFARVVALVGTLWNAEDAASFEVAVSFYENLQNDTERCAEALHAGVVRLRERYLSRPSIWAPCIYTGA